ncbi:MAG: AmpG family muropeptide MFS transporter, partial [Kofleriaceae bacterium]|nr:AmpG family muropeptide MFS transporter [Kofleriaceae bacterium]
VLVFLLFYKLGENIAGQLIHPFLIDIGFDAGTVGLINKGVGMPASIAGTILGGFAVTRIGIRRSLLIFGILQAVPNLLYGMLVQVGPSEGALTLIVITDQFCNGLAVAALVVFLMSLCDRRFTAFQYAALSSATAILGRFVSGWSGVIQEEIGWQWFFTMSALAGLPALVMLFFLPKGAGLPRVTAK